MRFRSGLRLGHSEMLTILCFGLVLSYNVTFFFLKTFYIHCIWSVYLTITAIVCLSYFSCFIIFLEITLGKTREYQKHPFCVQEGGCVNITKFPVCNIRVTLQHRIKEFNDKCSNYNLPKKGFGPTAFRRHSTIGWPNVMFGTKCLQIGWRNCLLDRLLVSPTMFWAQINLRDIGDITFPWVLYYAIVYYTTP